MLRLAVARVDDHTSALHMMHTLVTLTLALALLRQQCRLHARGCRTVEQRLAVVSRQLEASQDVPVQRSIRFSGSPLSLPLHTQQVPSSGLVARTLAALPAVFTCCLLVPRGAFFLTAFGA
eukprot:10740-Heterococcus_DN1.PRE.5